MRRLTASMRMMLALKHYLAATPLLTFTLIAFGALSISAMRSASRTAPTVTFTPSSFTTGSSSTGFVVSACVPSGSFGPVAFSLNSTDITGSVSGPDGMPDCGSGGADFTGTLSLANGANVFAIHICDTGSNCTDTSATYTRANPPDHISVALTDYSITEGSGTSTATATVYDAGNNVLTGQTISWSSTTTAAALVSGAGAVSAVSAGSTNITATVGVVSGYATLTVNHGSATDIILDQSSGHITCCGNTVGLHVTYNDDLSHNLGSSGPTITWSSDHTGIATVSSGTVTAVSAGMATITASSAGLVSATYDATVDPDPATTVTSVLTSPSSDQIIKGQADDIAATAYNASSGVVGGATFTWSSGNTGIATVNSSGHVTAVAVGSTYIRATEDNTGIYYDMPLTVIDIVASVTMSPTTATINTTQTQQLTATPKNSGGTTVSGATVTWTKRHSGIVTVNSSGLVSAVASGVDTVDATSQGHAAFAEITVFSTTVHTITVTPNPDSVCVSYSYPLSAVAKDAGGITIPGTTFTWSSSNTAVMTINASTGNVTGVAAGSATDTAHAGGATGTSTVVVRSCSGANLPLGISVVSRTVNPDSALTRDRCLTIAAGDGAYECGDLRLAHALPATRTYGVARAPMLVYNSRQASGYALLAANVSVDSMTPDTLLATVKISGHADVTRRVPWNSACHNTICRLVVPVPLSGTAAYPYTFEVKTIGGGAVLTGTDAGVLIFVDRVSSQYGKGWWVDGLEELRTAADSGFLWTGGDGSARLYKKLTDSTWVAPTISHPDTIVKVGSVFRRKLPGRMYVEFNSTLRHSQTVNSLGHVARFVYNGNGGLDSVVVPSPSGTLKAYTFFYSGSNHMLDSVRAPYGGGSYRTTRITHSANVNPVDVITDADSGAVHFRYATDRLVRRNRMGDSTVYMVDSLAGLKSMTQFLPDSIITHFCAAEATALNGCTSGLVLADSAYSSVTSPRTDLSAITRFWLNRYGTDTTVKDALGHLTSIHFDATWRGLAANTVDPIGHSVSVVYNARGNDSTVTDDNPYANAGNNTASVTTYTYAPRTDFLTRVVKPEGDSATFVVDTLTGNKLSQADGRGSGTAVTFTYDGTSKMLRTTVAPINSATDSLYYDALGNPNVLRSPLGYHTTITSDSIGRPVITVTPQDSSGTHIMRRDSVEYDVMSRVTNSYAIGGGVTYTLPTLGSATTPTLTMQVSNTYDAESRLTEMQRTADPDSAGVSTVHSVFGFDKLGRPIVESRDGAAQDSVFYDPAGNVTRKRLRAGRSLLMTYDALNRLTSQSSDSAMYLATNPCLVIWGGSCGGRNYHLPLYLDTLNIPGDTSTFSYDAAGHMLTANNSASHITRTWNNNGTMAADTQRVRTWTTAGYTAYSGDSAYRVHIYGLTYTYDKNGRRTALIHGAGFGSVFSGGTKTQSYSYSGDAGLLTQVTDIDGNAYHFYYDNKSRLIRRTSPGTAADMQFDSTFYDDEDRVVRRAEGYANTIRNADSTAYDAAGRMIYATVSDAGLDRVMHHVYNGLGAVVGTSDTHSSATFTEEFGVDAFGNVYHTTHHGTAAAGDTTSSYASYGGTTMKMTDMQGSTGTSSFKTSGTDTTHVDYDTQGNVTQKWTHKWTYEGPGYALLTDMVERNYYGGDNKLRFYSRQGTGTERTTAPRFEEYRYDALGRRVAMRSIADSAGGGATQEAIAPSAMERFVWDGDALLHEFRGAGRYVVAGPSLELDGSPDGAHPEAYGHVVYTVGGLDHPLAVRRIVNGDDDIIIPYTNYRGQFDAGTIVADTSDAFTARAVYWPGNDRITYNEQLHFQSGVSWSGSVITDYQGESGQQYKRNRYYDPSTGKFTQEDPIGLGGGMNLYGFANGDPVNNTDPFGLCVPFCPEVITAASIAIGHAAVAAGAATVTVGLAVAHTGAVLAHAATTLVHAAGVVSKTFEDPAPALGDIKNALENVHDKVGKLPKGESGKFGSPQRGNSVKGYRLDPAHPRAASGSPEAGWHINWWDYTEFKRSSGRQVDGAIPVKPPQ